MSVTGRPRAATIAEIRGEFPALVGENVFLDNAGASQLPRCVIEAAARYMRESYVQSGAEYALSRKATANIAAAHEFVGTFLNAGDRGRVVLGSSTTALCHIAANAYAEALSEGAIAKERNEIIVSSAGHEANIWPWMRLARRGFKVREWAPVRDATGDWQLNLDGLRGMLSDRTLLVAFPQVSNIFGDIWPAAEIAELTHDVGAKVMVDGVAFAPHRLPDMGAIKCDWYAYSMYKVFGPHMAALFGTHEAFSWLTGPNHYFVPNETAYKFELGGINHEGAAAINGGYEYLCLLAGERYAAGDACRRDVMERAFGVIEALETPLQRELLGGLSGLGRESRIELAGPARHDSSRVCTVSFLVRGKRSRDIAAALNAQGFGCRHGHFYSKRLVDAMGIADANDGVVRVSLAHYNTSEEVGRFLEALRGVVG